ncbi:HyaD/HybD family hydrogenase maturation endopeptidase [Desulfotalea psychrophila]|uniref:Probable hydrogenase maturation endopeptidase n=1 Tax=Desulfotalea psychrophila (strain LSv54 / DSM 12343) TaxID=177439 RepID=Q6AQR3_DESPS|nr:HyaD/HybD family hydrogenase maturation endopeptidase [Desulfotalea psychrophila]CAG35310.1 probable hydrogenase maturation endopeptidase [Desulfotalea psychrophila LSv54]
MKKIGIAGIGNLILRDEGFGVHTVKYLIDNYIFPDNVEIQDIGTAGIFMAPFLEECDPVFVIDVVDIEGEPGSFHYYDLGDVKAGKFQTRMSPHQLGLLEILEVCKLRDAAPEHIEFYTVIPSELTESVELSEIVAGRMVEVAEMIVTRLTEMGVNVEKR